MRQAQGQDEDTRRDSEKSEGAAQGSSLLPALTIVSHPIPLRVGEQLLLEALASGRPVQVARSTPDFQSPEKALSAPLGDPFLSRKPMVFSPGPGGAVRLDPGEGRQVSVPGASSRGPWEFSAKEVAEGVVLELAGRVVLLLHQADPSASHAMDALGMVGASAGLRSVRSQIAQVADLQVPVLIRGETGSGKELIARAIHQRSPRRDNAFVSVNLGAIPKELAAAELFGASKGAFTGAVKDREGFFRAAHRGTLFLDEVGEAPPEVQVMLLRVLETGEIFPVGERTPVKVDVRLISATDARLEEQIEQARFKAPLLHRLAGYELLVPPLRERREDIGVLFHHFAREELEALGEGHRLTPADSSAEPWLPAALASLLVRYPWPGNIRQLRNVVRQLIINNRGQPGLRLDPRLEKELSVPAAPAPANPAPAPLEDSGKKRAARKKLTGYTEAEIIAAFEASDWEIKGVSERLGVPRSSLYDWLERNPHIRVASRLSPAELASLHAQHGGDLDALARHLKVSRMALSRRLRELGLLPEG